MEIIYNKLIRDKMLSIIAKDSTSFSYHVADDVEYNIKLWEKLDEEIKEFKETPNDEEMADIMEVLHSIMVLYGVTTEMINTKEQKYAERGGFDARIILEKVVK